MDRPTPLVYGSESPVFTEAVVQSHSGEGPEGAEDLSSPDGVDRNYTEFTSRAPEAVTVQTDGRSRKLTEKGLEFQRSMKEKGYQKAMKVLKNTIDALDMVWTDLSDANVLREKRANLEDCRLNLQVAQLDYEPLLSVDEAQYLVNNSRDALRQAQELRSKIGDRIFELEREETRSRQSSRSSSSKRTRGSRASKRSSASHGSDRRQKALAEAARKQIDLKYAKIESQKKMELVARECAMDELQKMKEFERAKAEASVLGKVEAENRSLTMELLDLGTVGEENEDDHVSRYLSSLPVNKQVPVDTMAMPLNSANSVIPVYSTSVPLKSDPYVAASRQGQSKLQQDLNPDTAPLSLSPTKATTFTSYSTQYPLMYGDHIACQGSSPPAEANMTIPFGETSPSRALTNKNSPLEEEINRHHQLGIADAIAEGMRATRLPPPKLTVFAGNPLDWPTWKGAFEIVVEKRAINPSEKMLYLMQYLSGAPRKIVEGYQFVSSPDAYEEAKKTLEKRFGHPSVVAEAFRDKLEGWHKIPPRDGTALREFADFLKTCELAMSTVGDLGTLNMQHDNKMLVRVLPSWAHPKWGNKVRDYQLKHGNNTFPPFTTFARFVADIAEVQCLPVLSGLDHAKPGREASHGNSRVEFGRRRNHGASSLSTGAKEAPLPPVRSDHSCSWCTGSHLLDSCREFMKNSIKDRTKFIIRKGLCLRCLQHGHMAKDNRCTTELQCAVCTQRHPTCLHKYTKDSRHDPSATNAPSKQADKVSSNCVNVCSIEGQASGQDQSLILPVWVSNSENPREETLTYALIDCQSNATFITERLRRDLNANGVESQLLLSTMHGQNERVDCHKVRGLNVSDLEHQITIPLPKVFTRDAIPYSASQVPKPEVAMQWSHLKTIANKLMPFRADIEVGLLIGTDCPKAIKPREVIPGADQDPYGIRTDLGWGIIGRVCRSSVEDDDENTIWTNKIVTKEVTVVSRGNLKSIHNTTFAFESQAKEIFNPTQVKEMLELDFHERAQHREERALSVEDRRFLDILERGIHQREDGHYEMPLPLRSEDVRLPNNLPQALRRLSSLRARLEKDPKYLQDYVEFMEKVIRDCAEKVPALDACDVSNRGGKINYLAHHGVYHPKKPEKIRVVFDCSARYKGTSLNQNLLHGPDLTNSLVGVLCRFRQESVAFSCDIEAMFHQFFVNEEDRDMLRFLWWEGGDLERAPSEYRMKVHPFGAGSSPGCANFGLKRAADDGEEEFGPEAADLVRKNFYVDDGLKSVGTTSTAITLIQNCRAICSRAALRLHKFTSNSKEVIHAVSPEDRAKGLQDLDLRSDPLPMERPLGIMWCVETDCFQFRIVLQDRPFTRRGVLSTVSSIYDPLGLVAPLILVGKQILQDLCRQGADWDDPIPDDLRQRWEQWRSELHELESLKIQRCFKPGNLGEIKRVELHHFSDASQKGYGQCSYVRLIDEQNKIHCTLVMGKARVTPLKPVTIPRLELTAAVVSVRVSQWLNRELDYRDVVDVFWTDSRVVLGYISNEARRFHIFVANRVQEIHDHTEPKQWFYIETKLNPADAASRGLTAHQLVNESSWLRGPRFLWNPDKQKTPVQPNLLTPAPDDPEVKKVVTLATRSADGFPGRFETSRLDCFSEWHRAKRAVAVCLRFKDLLKKREVKKLLSAKIKPKMDKGPSQYQRVGLDELQRAELEIVREVQREHFKQEIKTLSSLKAKGEFIDRTSARQRNEGLKKSSSIYRLDPFLDEDGILRVGGRLRRANMSRGIRHPVILPRRSHITELMIRDSHLAIKHQGRGMTHNEIRQRGYWVIGGSSAVSNLIFKCIPCRRLRAPGQQQKMADLPEDRMEPAPPFTYCAVDYFGPFLIKEGRKELKRYGVLFTCMASRAVHVETANTLETDSFINALRRFLAERGPVRQMRSDRGTNFVGAKRELGEALKELDQSRIRDVLLKENCDWVEFKLNVPHASHMGGVWERQIRTVRSVLAALLEETGRQLDDEGFRTLLKEVQNIVNSRPLTSNGLSSPDAPEPLTPNHLLTSKTKILLPPPGIFQREDLYLRKRWRRVQHLTNEFWKRWRSEFLQTLQARQKWIKPRRNLQVDDVVLMKDEHTARNEWKLARVEETFPSDDGLVRKVKLAMATSRLDSQGRRLHEVQHLERPVQKLVLLQAQDQGDRH